jgi:formylglycine-generating enzyme required for sulfatase activity
VKVKEEEERKKKDEEETRKKETKEEKKRPREDSAASKAPEKSKCPDGMVLIPKGTFKSGSAKDDPMRNPGEKANDPVMVDAFCMDKFEYPNKEGELPAASLNWFEARQKCESIGKRLCSEDEWEKACKGPKSLKYPYGNDWDGTKCNTQDANGDRRPIAASGSFKGCKNDYGTVDMSGNLREWTETKFSPKLQDRVLKGGSFARPDWAARCADRYNNIPVERDAESGSRCCKTP